MRAARFPLRFGLRTLLAAMALMAVALGRDARLIRERDRLVQSVDFLRTFEPTPGCKSERRLPWHWKYLGARAIEYMAIRLPAEEYTLADVQRLQAVYPELEVTLLPVASDAILADAQGSLLSR
ncbi:MAG TPA: hypothetical protein VHD36_19245 [Pirellulales bacterium]|nr:hypothetical protein [Pirellulales bacterium]